MQAIGAASAFTTGQLPEACYTLLCAAGCAAVVFLGWRRSDLMPGMAQRVRGYRWRPVRPAS